MNSKVKEDKEDETRHENDWILGWYYYPSELV